MHDFTTCCQAILASPKTNTYAKAYAQAGLDQCPTPHAREVQALYILNNISSWRGPDAKAVREFLKTYSAGR